MYRLQIRINRIFKTSELDKMSNLQQGGIMKNKTAVCILAGMVVVLGGGSLVMKLIVDSDMKSNIYSVSEIRHDDSTYRYVKEKCDSGFFDYDSENCVNLRTAR